MPDFTSAFTADLLDVLARFARAERKARAEREAVHWIVRDYDTKAVVAVLDRVPSPGEFRSARGHAALLTPARRLASGLYRPIPPRKGRLCP